jgi:hypothetical protein
MAMSRNKIMLAADGLEMALAAASSKAAIRWQWRISGHYSWLAGRNGVWWRIMAGGFISAAGVACGCRT